MLELCDNKETLDKLLNEYKITSRNFLGVIFFKNFIAYF